MSGVKKKFFPSKKKNGSLNGVNSTEQQQALGNVYHKQCFKCVACGRFLDPGKHSEHEGKPYCARCYQSSFGPDGFRAGMVQPRPPTSPVKALPTQTLQERNEIDSRIHQYNMYKDNSVDHIKKKEVGDAVIYEGVLKIYWGLKKHITLQSNSYSRQKQNRESLYNYVSIEDDRFAETLDNAPQELQRFMGSVQSGIGLTPEDDLTKSFSDLLVSGVNSRNGGADQRANSIDEEMSDSENGDDTDDGQSPSTRRKGVILRQKSDHRPRTSFPVRRRSASFRKVMKQRREAEAREEKRSKFIPPYGNVTNLRVSSIQHTPEVVGMLMQKYNVENQPSEFVLYIMHDNGATELLSDGDCPLAVRLKLGPSEDVAKIYIMEAEGADMMTLSQEVAEYIKFQLPELQIFNKKFEEEESREVEKIRKRFSRWKSMIEELLVVPIEQNGTEV